MADLNTFTPPLAQGQTAFQPTAPIFNPNANYTAGVTPATAPQGTPVSSTPPPTPAITSSSITPQSPINIPPAPTPTDPTPTNASIPSPIPSIQSIVDQNTKPTDTANTQSALLGKIAALTGGQESLATQQNTAENTAGVPALTKTMNDLGAQLQGLNDQSTLLANNAAPGGTIDNLVQNKAQGTNDTGGGLAPIRADQLRANQIQQAGIAARSLTVKSAYYAAQGNYTLAKDAADKAAQVAFDATTQQINYQKALLDQITPQLNKEQAAQAAVLQAKLADRATQVATQQADFKTGQALAITAMQNNASDPTAQFNAQQALKLDPSDPQYLQKVAGLVGKYQTDQVQQQLDQQLKKAQIGEANANIAQSNASTAKSYNDIRIANASQPGPNGQVVGTTGNSTIDATTQGYTTQAVAGGLTQASIDQKALTYITSGTLPPQGRTGAAGIQNAAISNRMAEMDPNGNLAANKTQIKSLGSSLTQQTQYLNTTQRAFNTANDTLASLQNFMQAKNINPSQFPDYNSFSNFLKSKGIDPGAAGGYNAQITTLRQEYSQVLAKGGQRSVETDKEAAQLIPNNLAPSQLAQVAAQIKIDGENVVNDAQKQVSQIQNQISNIATGGKSSTSLPPEVDTALSNNATVNDAAKTVTIPRATWSLYPGSMDAIKAGIEAKGYKLLIQ